MTDVGELSFAEQCLAGVGSKHKSRSSRTSCRASFRVFLKGVCF